LILHCRALISRSRILLSISRVFTLQKDLEELGFVFKAGKSPNVIATVRKSWEERVEELLAFKDEHGHTAVPQLSGPLGGWVHGQRREYKKMKAGVKTSMTPEKALRLTEIGFQFEAYRK